MKKMRLFLVLLVVVSVVLSACGSQQPRIDKPGQPEGQVQGIYTYDLRDGKWTLTLIPDQRLTITEFYVIAKEGSSQHITRDDGDSNLYEGSGYSHSVIVNGYMTEGYFDTPLKYEDGNWVEFTFFANGDKCDSVEILPDSKNYPTMSVRHTFSCNRVLPSQ